MLDWGSWELGYGATQPALRLSKIANGTYPPVGAGCQGLGPSLLPAL